MSEGSLFFEGKGSVQDALRKITQRLSELRVPYAIVGGMALFRHGYRRFTEDVDLLVTREGLKLIHEKLEGLGYVPAFAQGKNLRDAELGVKIEFLLSGEFPGDGKPKPVSFPDPVAASFDAEGVRYLNLNALIELKLASGMSSPARVRDLSDVIELIKSLNLALEYAEKLNPYVQDKFRELWQHARRRFVLLWRNRSLTAHAKSLDEMIQGLRAAAATLEAMSKDGVVLDSEGGAADDDAPLVTNDPKVAEKYGMIEESEFWADAANEEGEEPDSNDRQTPSPRPPDPPHQ